MRAQNALVITLALAGNAAQGATYSGSLSDDTTGPIPAGVHLMNGGCSVPTGKVLTIQPGAVLKFASSAYFTLDGKLVAVGTVGQPITFTASTDDSIGGDTNGDGASSGSPGHWYGFLGRTGGAASVFDRVTIRYAGFGGYGGIHIEQPDCNLTITRSTIRDGSGSALNLNGTPSFPTVSNCSFLNNGGRAVENARIDSVSGFSTNTATGNGMNSIRISNANATGNRTITQANCLGGALFVDSQLYIAAGVTLHLQSGVVMKFGSAGYSTLDGTLHAQGSTISPVVFTSIADDSIGGDTNNDGNASVPTAGTWYGILAHTSGAASTLDHIDVRYAGFSGYGAIRLEQSGSNFTLTNSTIRNGGGPGIDFSNTVSTPTVSNVTLLNNAGRALENVRIDSVPFFSNLTASGNGLNQIRLSHATPSVDLSITAQNTLNGVLFADSAVIVPSGRTLSLGAGVTVKFGSAGYMVLDGTLLASGNIGSPVTFTSLADDSFGGDTNGDGPSSGAPGTWYGIQVHSTSAASVLDRVTIRHAGFSGYGALRFEQPNGNITMTSSSIRDNSGPGIDLTGQAVVPSISYTSITNNGGVAIDGARFDSIAGLLNDVVSGNGGNYIRVSSGALSQSTTVTRANCLERPIVLDTQMTIPLGIKLTFESGVIVKFNSAGYLGVSGALEIEGTATNPVTFTALTDDSSGGDTNGDGNASLPSYGFWHGIAFSNSGTTVPSLIQHLVVRYSGFSGHPGITTFQPLIGIVGCRIEYSNGRGYYLRSGGAFSDLTAYACSGDGIFLESGNALLGRVTTAANGGAGISALSGFNGSVTSAIAFGNGGGGIVGLDAGELRYSNGSPTLTGSNGNINMDPKFVDLGNGDLRLQSNSPCVDAGDPFDTPYLGRDQSGAPRFLNGDLAGTSRIDMGAYEYDNVRLSVTGTLTPGGSMTIGVTGKAGLNTLLFLGTAPGAIAIPGVGPLFLDLGQTWVSLSWGTVPSSVVAPIPSTFPPLSLVMQVVGTNGTFANTSNAVELTIE